MDTLDQSEGILVHSRCYNKMSQTEWLTNKRIYSHSSKVCKSKIRMPEQLGESSSSLQTYIAEEDRNMPGTPFIRALYLLMI